MLSKQDLAGIGLHEIYFNDNSDERYPRFAAPGFHAWGLRLREYPDWVAELRIRTNPQDPGADYVICQSVEEVAKFMRERSSFYENYKKAILSTSNSTASGHPYDDLTPKQRH